MNPVKLPPAAAVVPAARPQGPDFSEIKARNDAAGINRESFGDTRSFIARGVGGGGGLPPEQLLYKTEGAWRGIDVYVRPVPPPAGFSSQGTLSIFIYALVDGLRVLVASGRYSCTTGAGANLPERWVAGVRSIATLFQVTSQWTQFSGAPVVVGDFAFSIEASNEAVELPPDLGSEIAAMVYLQAAAAGVATGLGVNIAGVQIPNRLELVNVRASNGAAAARFLQLFDTNLPIVADGTAPLMEWPLGAAIGAGLGLASVRYRSINRVQLVASSTTRVLTVQTDCTISAEVR